jgi:hypothetical protein
MPLINDSPAGADIYSGDKSQDCEIVSVISFGEWLRNIDGDFDLVKLDCEGAEWEIVRQTDHEQFARIQTVIIEVHPDPEGIHSIPQFKDLIEKFGFRTVRWDNKSHGLYIGSRRPRS